MEETDGRKIGLDGAGRLAVLLYSEDINFEPGQYECSAEATASILGATADIATELGCKL